MKESAHKQLRKALRTQGGIVSEAFGELTEILAIDGVEFEFACAHALLNCREALGVSQKWIKVGLQVGVDRAESRNAEGCAEDFGHLVRANGAPFLELCKKYHNGDDDE